MTSATALTNELLMAVSKKFEGRIVLWRNNSGAGVGWSVAISACRLIRSGKIKEGLGLMSRPVFFGLKGSSDLIGLISPSGTFIGIEVKAGGDTINEDQESFGHLVGSNGGIYLICRDVADTIARLKEILAK